MRLLVWYGTTLGKHYRMFTFIVQIRFIQSFFNSNYTIFFITSFFISSLKHFDWASLTMHLSACWIWLISSIWRFPLAKLIVTLLFSPVSILYFLWWLTFHFSINAITGFNFTQQECLFSKLETKSSFVITEPTFIYFFHSRSDVAFWFASWVKTSANLILVYINLLDPETT